MRFLGRKREKKNAMAKKQIPSGMTDGKTRAKQRESMG
jgi:hypothetical protein